LVVFLLHSADIEVLFPVPDRTEIHLLLTVKDGQESTPNIRKSLLVGHMLKGSASDTRFLLPPFDALTLCCSLLFTCPVSLSRTAPSLAESFETAILTRLAFTRSSIGTYFRRIARAHNICAVCPPFGYPFVAASISSSSSTSSAAAPSAGAAPIPKEDSSANLMLLSLADSFGPARVVPVDKKSM
jgi:hypothetical protein